MATMEARTTSIDWVRPFEDLPNYTDVQDSFADSQLPAADLLHNSSGIDATVPTSSEVDQDVLALCLEQAITVGMGDISMAEVADSVPLKLDDATAPEIATITDSQIDDVDMEGKKPLAKRKKITAINSKMDEKERKHPSKKQQKRKSKQQETKVYVARKPTDVLLGRGGLTNHNPGNHRYLNEVTNSQPWYVKCSKQDKTKMAEGVVAYVQSYGGRFLQKDDTNGKWFVVSDKDARRKASQALREHKTHGKKAK